jgi:hypothetical protein
MIVTRHCCKVVRRTKSGLQAHPPVFMEHAADPRVFAGNSLSITTRELFLLTENPCVALPVRVEAVFLATLPGSLLVCSSNVPIRPAFF